MEDLQALLLIQYFMTDAFILIHFITVEIWRMNGSNNLLNDNVTYLNKSNMGFDHF